VDRLLAAENPVLRLEDDRRSDRLTTNRVTFGRSEAGRVVVLSDVTEAERHRRELERQNERLEGFANVVSHDLRNPLNVATSRFELARETGDGAHLEAAMSALDRMDTLIDDVLTHARQGQSIGETATVPLSDLLENCRATVELGDATLALEGDLQFEADPEGVQQLLENPLRNAIDHGGDAVAIRVGATEAGDGFFVADDGSGIPPDEREQVFDSGYTTAEGGTRFGLAIVAEVAEAHGWEIDVRESEAGGARFEISGVQRPWPKA
jgi:signal transduction histidine kinase